MIKRSHAILPETGLLCRSRLSAVGYLSCLQGGLQFQGWHRECSAIQWYARILALDMARLTTGQSQAERLPSGLQFHVTSIDVFNHFIIETGNLSSISHSISKCLVPSPSSNGRPPQPRGHYHDSSRQSLYH